MFLFACLGLRVRFVCLFDLCVLLFCCFVCVLFVFDLKNRVVCVFVCLCDVVCFVVSPCCVCVCLCVVVFVFWGYVFVCSFCHGPVLC